MSRAPGHPQVTLTMPGHGPVDVDRGMVRLVGALWRAGARTGECCQGGDGDPAYVVGDRRALTVVLDALGQLGDAARLAAIAEDRSECFSPAVTVEALTPDWWAVELAPDDVGTIAGAIGASSPRRALADVTPAAPPRRPEGVA